MDEAKVMNLKFNHVCTTGNELGDDSNNYKFHTELDEILKDSDVVLTDSLTDEYRTSKYINKYQIF
jgi:ornithine carbamoyltransferase